MGLITQPGSSLVGLWLGFLWLGRGAELGKPSQLHGCGGVFLQTGFVDGRLPSFVLDPGIHLEVGAEAFDDAGLELVLGSAAGDEVFGGLFVEIFQLHPLVAGEVIGQPCLAALGLASNPVAHDEALVGIALQLDRFKVVELTAIASGDAGIGGDGLDPEIELVQLGKL